MKTLLIILALSGPVDRDAAMLFLSGASSMEEMDEESVEHFRRLSSNPLNLNHCSRSTLTASGLFTPLQISSLLDYRTKNGDILSFAELSLLDAFYPEYVDALRFFVCLTSNSPPGQRNSLKYSHELRLRASSKHDGSNTASFRYEGRLGDRAELLLSERNFSAAYYGKRFPGKIVLGSYKLRFAQGLLNWTGFSMSGYSSVSSFYKRSQGISCASSPDGKIGIASDYSFGANTVSAAYSFNDKSAMLNFTRSWKTMTAGAGICERGASADIQFSLPGAGIFSELACLWDGSPALLAGAHWNPDYGYKYALLLKGYAPAYKEYSGIALGVELPSFTFTADWGYRTDKLLSRTRLQARYDKSLSIDSVSVDTKIIAKCRYTPSDSSPLRSELRAELGLGWKSFLLNIRADLVHCSSLSWHWYIEAGRKTDIWGFYIRGGLFKADDWDDRIYVYERNAPGSFSVPAYYGRGWTASLYAWWHLNRHHSIYLRLEKTDYPWNLSEKPGKSALKLQYRHRF